MLGSWIPKVKLELKNLQNSVINKNQPSDLRETGRVWKLCHHKDMICRFWLPNPVVKESPEKPLCVCPFHRDGSMEMVLINDSILSVYTAQCSWFELQLCHCLPICIWVTVYNLSFVIYEMGKEVLSMPWHFSDYTIIVHCTTCRTWPHQVLTKCWLLLLGH